MASVRFKKDKGNFVATNYKDYLYLDSIIYPRELASQANGGQVHDELLFIVIHQNIEIWFFQALEEAREARRLIRNGEIRLAIDELNRLTRIFAVLTVTWDVLATLRPREFWKFREFFGGASGFQSAQFRELEFALGLRGDADRDLLVHRRKVKDKAACQRLTEELGRPSLWDEVILALKRDFDLPSEITDRNWRLPYPYPVKIAGEEQGKGRVILGCRALEEAWIEIYSNRPKYIDLYDLGEQLLDLSAGLSNWRFKHIVTVERFIGRLPGSNRDSLGVPYLLQTLDKRAFPELWSVRDSFAKWSDRYKDDRPST